MNQPHACRGTTLAELLITTTLFVLIAGVVVQTTGSSLRRAEVNAIAVELAGWLDSVQRETMSRNELSGQAQPCTITFTPGPALETGTVLARVASGCAPGSPHQNGEDLFLLPGGRAGSRFRVEALGGQNPNELTYTPRGTTTLTEPRTLVISREGGGPVRCLRITPLLGTVVIGAANNPAGPDSICAEESFGGTI